VSIKPLAEVKAQLCVAEAADDGLIVELQAAADSFVAGYCGRAFAGGSYAETHPGGGRFLFLVNYPAAGVTVAGVDPAGYRVHADRGVVEAVGGPFPPGPVAVAYTVAAGQVPATVGRAYVELVGHWYRQAKTHAAAGQLNLATVTAADGACTTYPYGQSTGYQVPAAVTALLAGHRVPAV